MGILTQKSMRLQFAMIQEPQFSQIRYFHHTAFISALKPGRLDLQILMAMLSPRTHSIAKATDAMTDINIIWHRRWQTSNSIRICEQARTCQVKCVKIKRHPSHYTVES